ncbi:MAG: PQQ-binding-like beta-propeller repeat protein, partial [Lachnospiraceae bacterium]|nr:PQQ-binding-like beta-propeller repeat protein [Lachnospiraceae bacterium]
MKRLTKGLSLLLIFALVFTSVQPIMYTEAKAATVEAKQGTLVVDLQDQEVQKASKRNVKVLARDENGDKIDCTLTFDGDVISPAWDDSVQTSYVLDFSKKTSGNYTVIVTAGDMEQQCVLRYEKAQKGEYIGDITFDVELFSIDKGYLIEPIQVPIYEGENVAQELVRVLKEKGYGYEYTGRIEDSFYLSRIYGSNYASNKLNATTSLDASNAHMDDAIVETEPYMEDYFDAEDYTEGALGEFDYNFMSGWMYAVNGSFANVGMGSYYAVPGDVVRIQFTLYYGRDIGGTGSTSGDWADMFPVAKKDSLTKLLATINASENADEIKANKNVKAAWKKAVSVLDVLNATQTEVDQAENTLRQALNQTVSYDKDNSRITNAKTPISSKTTELLWGEKIGGGYGGNMVSCPVIVNDNLICTQGKNILKINKTTGNIIASSSMVGASSFSILPPTYANGMIFVGLSDGRIQAFDADTLQSLWVYQDSLKGQPNSPIVYADGYVYTGFWNSEIKDANFVCVSVEDTDKNNATEAKNATWTNTIKGGFYWAGAYVSGDYVYVGTDDGVSGSNSASASLICYNKQTGQVIDQISNLVGDLRSSITYDKASNRLYFTSKGGYLYSVSKNADGTFVQDSLQTLALGGASTSTPVIYNGRMYVGVSGSAQFGANGHHIAVIDILENGEMSVAYTVSTSGYPQTSGLISTGYEAKEGSVYVYFTCNCQPGGITVLKDKKGQKEAISEELFQPSGVMAQYCICNVIADEEGVLYYKNDSSYLMAVHTNEAYLENVTFEGGNAVMDHGVPFQSNVTEHEIVVEEGTKEVTVSVETNPNVSAIVSGQAVKKFSVPVQETADFCITAKCGADTKKYNFHVREQSKNADTAYLLVNTSNSFNSSLVSMTSETEDDVVFYHAEAKTTTEKTKAFWNIWVDSADENASVKLYPLSELGNKTALDTNGCISVTATTNKHSRYAIYFADDYSYAAVKVEITAENKISKKEYIVLLDRKKGMITPTPKATATPIITIAPVVTTSPAVTVTPIVTTAVAVTTSPAVTVTPIVTTAVAVTTSPAVTVTPIVTTAVAVTTSPAVTVTPIVTTAAAVTTSPAVTVTPIVTTAAAVTTSPAVTVTPIVTTAAAVTTSPAVTVTPIVTTTPVTITPTASAVASGYVFTATPNVSSTP